MKKITTFFVSTMLTVCVFAQGKIEWVATTQSEPWQILRNDVTLTAATGAYDVKIETDKPLQTMEGFGTCFNELGWTSLSLLTSKDRDAIFKELFAPGAGANFTICRMPVAANDFSNNWYSYNETAGDFKMKNFSIAADMQTLIPFIKSAKKYNPVMQLWASPWSPPTWMKYNKHYALKNSKAIDNGLQPGQEGSEDADMFIQQEPYFKAYALYFEKFVKAYQQQGIKISMVMPQNEFKAVQIFPSCTWTAAGLAKFIRYLAPAMAATGTSVFFGTMNSGNEKLADTILTDPQINKYIKGIGLQWAGKEAIEGLHKRYPNLTIYQTEQECGDGKNDWAYAVYTWGLMKHYINNGANAYMYWNTALKQGGISTWGWQQNSLISVDTAAKTYTYNHEYYVMKHLSHYVMPGAKRLQTEGDTGNLLAFINPDKSVALVVFNDAANDKMVRMKIGNRMMNLLLKAASFNTVMIK